jgi:uncharacterized protein YhdP
LPRRLSFNFSDLVKQGFSFDKFKADVKLQVGNAYTSDAEMSGPAADVKIAGRIGLANKDYDLRLTTIPHVTSSLPVIAAIAGGPVAGVITWLADRIVGSTISRASTYVYKVTGSWSEPNIEKM